MLIPEQKTGIILIANSSNGNLITGFRFLTDIINYYSGKSNSDKKSLKEANISEYTGLYRIIRRPYSNIEKSLLLFSNVMEYSSFIREGKGNNELVVDFVMEDTSFSYFYAGKDLFTTSDGKLSIEFLRDEKGKVSHNTTSIAPAMAFEKINPVPSFRT